MDPIYSVNLDANEGLFFSRQLEQVKASTYEIQYPALKATQLIPVSTEINRGAETIVYRVYDRVGLAKIISDYAHDLPRVDVLGRELTGKIRSIGDSYGYSVQEIRAAAYANTPLEARRAQAARLAIDELINRLAFTGDAEYGLLGFLNHPNVPVTTVAADGTAGATEWTDKTAALIIRDMNDLVNGIVTTTRGIERPNMILMPLAQYTLISTMRANDYSDVTVLEYFRRNQPGITVDWLPFELDGTGTGGTDVMIAYTRDPSRVTLELPQPFEQFPPQERGLEFIVPCHARFAGVRFHYPLSASVAEGI